MMDRGGGGGGVSHTIQKRRGCPSKTLKIARFCFDLKCFLYPKLRYLESSHLEAEKRYHDCVLSVLTLKNTTSPPFFRIGVPLGIMGPFSSNFSSIC